MNIETTSLLVDTTTNKNSQLSSSSSKNNQASNGGKMSLIMATACVSLALAPFCYIQGARSAIARDLEKQQKQHINLYNNNNVQSLGRPTTTTTTTTNRDEVLADLSSTNSFNHHDDKNVVRRANAARFAKKFVEAYEHDKVERRMSSSYGSTSSSSSSSDANDHNGNLLAAALGSSKKKVPIYVIALEDRPEEFEKYEDIRAIFPTAEPTHGVDPLQWPNRIEDAQYAVKGLRTFMATHQSDPAIVDFLKVRQEPFVPSGLSYGKDDGISPGINWIDKFDNFKEHPWLMAIDHREADGRLTDEEVGRAHHIGCLFAHLYQWQLMLDRGEKKALIFESDAPRIMEAIPFWASEQVADHAPVDTDILLIRAQHVGEKPPGPLVTSFLASNPADNASEHQTINIHKYKSAGAGAGLEAYVVTSSFAKKAQAYMAKHGADMIDGYIIKLCQSSYKHAIYERAYYSMYHEDMFLEPYDAANPKPTVFNCYVASTPGKAA